MLPSSGQQVSPSPLNYRHLLHRQELWWRDHQEWLQERGYLLRPRYRPDWIPSWINSGAWDFACADGHSIIRRNVLDATRIVDNAPVVLKRVPISQHPHEVEISLYLSKELPASDPTNHSVPIYEVIDVPEENDTKLLVMPLLRDFSSPPFLTVGEVIEFVRQCIEGLQFMHSHHVAHRDIGQMNVMMDPQPLFPNLYHFVCTKENKDLTGYAKYYTRTRRPTKYYFIDFGISRKYDPAAAPREWPIWGADRTVPEFQHSDDPCDPFPTDIYYLGNLIRTRLLAEYRGLEFMQPLVDEMVQDEPSNRPTIDQISERFDLLMGSLSTWRLRSRLPPRNEVWLMRYFRTIVHAFRTMFYIVSFHPALPRP